MTNRLTPGLCLEDDHIKRRPCPTPYHKEEQDSLSVQCHAGANWTLYLSARAEVAADIAQDTQTDFLD